MQHTGRYEIRYRLLLRDGRQRDVHALTEVRSGDDGQALTLLGVLIDDTEGADRVRAQQAVSAKLAQALELAMISVWRIDLQRRRIHFNDIGYRLGGVEPTADGIDLEQMRAQAHPDDQLRILQAAEQAMASDGVVDLEARYRNPDGSYRHLLTRRVAERDALGRVVALAGISLDQTAQIAERERSQALAQRIQAVADAAGVGIWSIEHAGDAAAERVEWNAQMFRIYGLDEHQPAPPLSDWMGTRVHAADRQRVADERRRARASGRADFETEFRVVRTDGTLRWVVCRSHREPRAGPGALHGIHIDVTRQRQIDRELRLHEQRLQLATRFAGVGCWERDLAGDRLIWDEQMYRLRGLGPDDPRTPVEIEQQTMLPQAYAQRLARLQRHLEDHEPFELEFEVRWPDGSVRWLASTGRAVREEGGAGARMLGLNWDITERKRAEAVQREMAAADRANRAKSEFLARMSHELRTPLNAILGFAQLMQHDTAGRLDATQAERLARIRSAGAHLLSLIEDVLDLAAVEAGALPVALHSVSLDETLQEVREWVAPMAAELRRSLRLQPSGAIVLADRRRLRQIVTNLVTNALKYNRAGGWVQLSAQRIEVDGRDGWELSVRDNGRGLSDEQQAHLFEPFNRLGAEREGIDGSGIGLSTVQQLVQLLGGRLRVQSRSGQGSDFRVWLPAAEARDAAAPTRSLRVLYVEDNPLNVRVLQELVAMWPHVELNCASDGRSGVALALREPHDLVLVDMQLPDIDGHEVLRRLRVQDCRATLVALSANALPDERVRALAAGFDDYWTKPLDFKQLMAGLDRLNPRE
jgi:PAS domain S-box-containing protein